MLINSYTCKEVLTYISYFDDKIIKKLPSEFLKKLCYIAADEEKNIYVDKTKKLKDQNISDKGKELIKYIYYKYIADEKEKEENIDVWKDIKIKYESEEL